MFFTDKKAKTSTLYLGNKHYCIFVCMTNVVPLDRRHYIMSQVHSTSTKPELKLRRALWRLGFRYRVNDRHLPGSPDIVLPKHHTVIFVHGCFWHGHNGCKFYSVPKTNVAFWTAKITRNQERDQEVWRQLEAKGWYVIIVWECQLKKVVLEETISKVTATIHQNGEAIQQIAEERKKAREAYQLEMRSRREREACLRAELVQH